jgi:hypothetical protein
MRTVLIVLLVLVFAYIVDQGMFYGRHVDIVTSMLQSIRHGFGV